MRRLEIGERRREERRAWGNRALLEKRQRHVTREWGDRTSTPEQRRDGAGGGKPKARHEKKSRSLGET